MCIRDSVVATDLECVMRLLQQNVLLSEVGGVSLRAAACGWGEPLSDELQDQAPFERILLSDVVYEPEGYAPLVQSLGLLSGPDTVIVLVYRHRNPDDHLFWALLRERFSVDKVEWTSVLIPDMQVFLCVVWARSKVASQHRS
eukprot:TRINITY_DN8531_c0_g1_i2.p1 TRINITY_DN8531_c0_g1~~TRINITY_DN8531_c0_g1_i2.p1  ORF type:complete len:143 (-),score=29.19 TRINITY_DN8531_c0_g1_i2:13-441(-)